ncbi:hypothetical protein BASA81_005416 [Batrachochytrium salamandrivorans]|nr:hypothetical protein BASA81_005416 [Batrachochytrium salamandrivorans]
MSASSAPPPSKAAKVDEEACLKQDSIPIHGVSRMLRFKVADEIHAVFKSEVKGFDRAHRFVCKEHWDVNYVVRFKDLDSIVAYMNGDVKTNQVEPLIKEIETLIQHETASQNFVADDWN